MSILALKSSTEYHFCLETLKMNRKYCFLSKFNVSEVQIYNFYRNSGYISGIYIQISERTLEQGQFSAITLPQDWVDFWYHGRQNPVKNSKSAPPSPLVSTVLKRCRGRLRLGLSFQGLETEFVAMWLNKSKKLRRFANTRGRIGKEFKGIIALRILQWAWNIKQESILMQIYTCEYTFNENSRLYHTNCEVISEIQG